MSTIYIHWPFCLSKCHYCDFHSIACRNKIDFDIWHARYLTVLRLYFQELYDNSEITSIYFGGGTPSLMPVWFVESIISEIYKNCSIVNSPEITIEMNPKTINSQKAKDLKQVSINRVSIGVQSLIDRDLRILGRSHSAQDAIESIYEMNKYFDNISIDMIYNRPNQDINSWNDELLSAISLPISHVSLYELILEDGTILKKMIDSKELPPLLDTDIFMKKTISIAEKSGFKRYEVSNFAKNDMYGKHNLSYWKYEDYFGIGPGSHSRITINNKKHAIEQVADNTKWLEWAVRPVFDTIQLTDEDVYKERLIMGLRAKCGVHIDDIPPNIKINHNFEKKLEKLLKNSYIILEEGRIVLTDDGLMKLDMIIGYMTESVLI